MSVLYNNMQPNNDIVLVHYKGRHSNNGATEMTLHQIINKKTQYELIQSSQQPDKDYTKITHAIHHQ